MIFFVNITTHFSVILLTEYHAVKSVFDEWNPPAVDEISYAMKSCFAGLYLDGFDFIQGLVLGFHLNEVKISSLPCNDFIKPTEKERTFQLQTDLFSLSACNMGLGLAHKVFDQTNAMLALSSKLKFSAKDITHSRDAFCLILPLLFTYF